jgi:2-polyprenyl-3-methyl-5-hydroxy-6-metoxy-1,4-benzoquinol methylase
MIQPSCPACGGSSFEALEKVDAAGQHALYAPGNDAIQMHLTEAAAATALDYQMFRCNRCALEFCAPLKAPTSNWYGIAYSYSYPDLERPQNQGDPGDRWDFDAVIRRVRPGQKLFEIGCGPGKFLEKCRASGIEAQGVDFMEGAVRECIAKGLRANLERVGGDSLPPPVAGFDHISSFQVLEHLDNPRSLFEKASGLAGKHCHLWLSVPSDRRPSRHFGERDFLDQPPHHMSRWTPAAFSAIGAQAGWKLAEILYEPMSLRVAAWSIVTASAPYKRAKSSGSFASPWRERAFRFALMPYAVAKRMTTERQLSGFSMLAHFVTQGAATTV